MRLLHAKIVRPFVSGDKTDATDARAIWLAVQQPGVKFVGIKSAPQQATLTLHRQRELLMKMRLMQTNALRGLLYEFGATFAKGNRTLLKEIETTLEGLADTLPQPVRQDAAFQEGVELVLDETGQFTAGTGFGVRYSAGRMLLRQALQRDLLGAVAVVLHRARSSHASRWLARPRGGVHGKDMAQGRVCTVSLLRAYRHRPSA